MKAYITMGQAHIHRISGKTIDKDVVVEIEAEDETALNDRANYLFGREWIMMYASPPDMSFYPRGIVKL